MEYSQAIADLICEALAEGHSLRSICKSDDFPSKANVFRWLSSNKDFADQYAHAREAQADALFDEILEIILLACPSHLYYFTKERF